MSGQANITLNLEVLIIKEGEQFVSYCPALELSSYGNTEDEAKKSFEEALDIFLEDTMNKKTLEKELISLGWTLSRDGYTPPHLKLSDIVSTHPEKAFQHTLAIPA